MALSEKVRQICDRNWSHRGLCGDCPLLPVCDIEKQALAGASLEDKTEAWEEAMNKSAEDVENERRMT